MENTNTENLAAKWDKTFEEAEATQSPTFTQTMDVSRKAIEDIENYLQEKGDTISVQEQTFLNTSIELKKMNEQNRATETEQIEEVQTEIKEMSAKQEEGDADVDVGTLSGKDRAELMRKNSDSGNFDKNYDLVDDIHEEREELLKLQDSWFNRVLQSDKSFTETGESRYTKMGDSVDIVTNSKGEKYIRIEEVRGGGGDPGNQSIKRYYVKLEKAQPYLA